MADIIHARHPVPLRVVPKGGTAERLVFAQAVTPVRLRHVARGELEPLGTIERDHHGRPRPYFALEGGQWTPLQTSSHDPSVWMREEELRGFLAGEGDRLPVDGTDAFWKTPLLAVDNKGASREWSRGVEVDPRTLRRVVEDLRERAAHELDAFVERRIVVADDAVFIRATPVCMHPGPSYQTGRYNAVAFPHYTAYAAPVARPDNLQDFWEVEKPFIRRPRPAGYWECVTIPGDNSLCDDTDLLHFANELPRMILLRADGMGAAMRRHWEGRLEPLRHWRALGSIGSVSLAEAEEVFALAREQAQAMLDFWPDPLPDLELACRYVDRIALPRLRAPAAVAEADLDAFAALGPGGP